MKIVILTIIFFSMFVRNSFGQIPVKDEIEIDSSFKTFLKSGIKVVGDKLVFTRGVCKNNYGVSIITKENFKVSNYSNRNVSIIQKKKMSIVGNLTYEYLYRSYLDTPFVQNDFSQHTIHSNLQITTPSGTPLKLNFRVRLSNSPFFKDNFDFTSMYSKDMMMKNIKTSMKRNIPNLIPDTELLQLEKLYNEQLEKVRRIQNNAKSPATLQKIVEQKERASRKNAKKKGIDDLVDISSTTMLDGDTLIANKLNGDIHVDNEADFLKNINDEKASAISELRQIEIKINQLKKKLSEDRRELLNEVNQLNDAKSLDKVIKKYNVSDTLLPRKYKFLLGIEKLGLGRNWVDYSELTVKNMLISGVNVETNFHPMIFSVAVGSINYGFRDFVLNQARMPSQRLFAFRAGIGKTNGNKLIFTYFTGRKALLNSYSIGIQETESVSGLAVEGQFKLLPSTFISLEFAKSTLPNYLNSIEGSGKMLDFGFRSNEAYAIKFSSDYFKNTKVQGFYRKGGDQFQSFNMMPVSVEQEAWSIKLNKTFFKRKVNIDAGLRKNDFANNLTNIGLHSSTLFKTFLMNVRIPKYPFVSLGFYPGTQLTVLEGQRIAESQYNTFNAVVGYAYRYKKTFLNSNIVFVKFSSDVSDTNFIYANANSVTISQHLLLNNFSAQLSFSNVRQSGFSFQTLDGQISYKIKSWITLQAGLKEIKSESAKTLYGKNGGLQLRVFNLGNINLNYEQNYLPARGRRLMPVDFGRLIYTKTFK